MKGQQMSRYSDLTVDQIRYSLSFMEKSYGIAMEAEAYGLANALMDKVEGLREALVSRIRAVDPYTSEADIRFFEGLAY